MPDAQENDLITIFQSYAANIFILESNLSSQDEALFDSFITYSLILFNAKNILDKISRTYNVNLNYNSAFKIINHFERFQYLE